MFLSNNLHKTKEIRKLINSKNSDLNSDENRKKLEFLIDEFEKQNTRDSLTYNDYELILNNITDFIWIYDSMAKKLIYVSPSVNNVLGYSEEEFINIEWDKIYTEESLKLTLKQIESEAFLKGVREPIISEKQMRHKNGSILWVEERTAPVLDKNGNFLNKAIGITRDINYKKELKQKLKQSEEKYRFLVENISDVLWILDIESEKFTYVSPAVEALRGYTSGQVMQMPMNQAITKESAEYLEKVLPGRLRELQQNPDNSIISIDEIDQIHKDGHIVNTEVQSHLQINEQTGKFEVIGVSRDITSRKLLERKLKQSEEKYRFLTEKISDAIWVYNIDKDELSYVSPAMENILGYSSEELMKIPIKNQMTSESYEKIGQSIKNRYFEFKKNGSIPDVTTEVMQPAKNGNIVTTEISTHYRYNDNGEVEIVGVTRDISDRKRIENELMQSQKRYRTLFNNTGSIMLLVDPETGQILDVNESACDFYGYAYDDFIKLNIKDINTLNPEEIEKQIQRAKDGKRSFFNFIHKLADGQERFVEVYSSRINIQDKPVLFSIVHDVTSSKKMERLLEQERKQFISILDNIPELIYIADKDTHEILYVNKIVTDLMGKDITGKKCYDVIQNKTAPCDFCTNDIIFNNKDAHMWEYYNPVYKKHYYVIDKAIKWMDGRDVRFELAIDITKQKEAEQELKRSKEEFETIFENANIGTCIVSPDGKFTKVNKRMTEIFGYSKEEMLNLKINDITVPEDKEISSEFIKNAMDGKHTRSVFEKRYYSAIGHIVYGLVSSTLVKNQDGEFFISHVKDITQQKRTEQEIKKLKIAIEQSPANIVITDIKGNIEYVNPAFTKQTGYTFEEAMGKNPRVLKSGETSPDVYKDLWKTILSGKSWRGEFVNIRKSGEKYWELAHISPVIDEYGKIINFIAIKDDITERKKAEIKLQKTKKELEKAVDSKDKFFSIIAHDLRSPFNALLGYLELLIEEGDKFSEEEKEMFIKNVFKSALNTFKLLENLLVWSNAQSGSMTYLPVKINMENIIYEVVSLSEQTATQKNIMITHEKNDVEAFADAEMIKAILRNLISNAIKFTPRNGKIIIDAYEYNEYFVRVDVEDNGRGMEWYVIDALFKIDKNYSTPGTEKEPGSGLGLIIAQEFVKWHGGKIWVESIPGTGSVFSFTVPKKGGI